MRFLHAADIHLDSPLRGLSRYEGAPLQALRGATRQALVNLVDQALELRVDFLLIAGDLYDGDWPDYNTGLFFCKQMARLERAEIPVIALCGNHDAESRLTRGLRLPSNVSMLSVDRPETVLLSPLKVAIHGQGFKHAAVLENLTENYPCPLAGFFNIGLLHTSVEGRPGHAGYAPCTVEALKNLGYDYWALGHVHQREVLCQDPFIVFPGNLQGRHARETGPKGATLVELEDGTISSVEHLALDVIRWHRLRVDITGTKSREDFEQLLLSAFDESLSEVDGRTLAIRVEIVGESPLHGLLVGHREHWINEIRNLAMQVGSDTIWVEKVKFQSRTERRLDALSGQEDAFASILAGLENLAQDPERLRTLGKELFSELEKKLPLEWRRTEFGGIEPSALEVLREALADLPHLLATRLSGAQEEST